VLMRIDVSRNVRTSVVREVNVANRSPVRPKLTRNSILAALPYPRSKLGVRFSALIVSLLSPLGPVSLMT
jgi:hypothetical protein